MNNTNISKLSIVTKLFNSKVLLLLLFVLFSLALFLPTPAKAASFEAGRIIDDSIFVNKNSMTVADIQNFLNSKVPACNRWHAGFTGASGTVYSPPWTCLKEYNENPTTRQNNIGQFNSAGSPVVVPGGLSAAQIIWNASQTYSINPQVILVTLQKETGLITDDWAASWQYRTAMGFGCPDGAPCDAQWFGFANQVTQAARHFRNFYDLNPAWYIPYRPGVNFIKWNPNSACGGTNVNIQNRATAALYSYTPYQPNTAALNNLYGSGDSCSAYGNRNFWRDFTGWFGSTVGLTHNGLSYSAVFDPIYYLNNNPDVQQATGGDQIAAFDHFINNGMKEGRQASPNFNVTSYRNRYADLRWSLGSNLAAYYAHYITNGSAEGRIAIGAVALQPVTLFGGKDYSSVYNFNTYINTYTDIKNAYGNDDVGAITHFVLSGMKEGRQASPNFNVVSYKNRYYDLRAAFGNNLTSYYLHYIRSGVAEGRIGN